MFSAATIHKFKGHAHRFIVSRLIFALLLAAPGSLGAAELRAINHRHDVAVANSSDVSPAITAATTSDTLASTSTTAQAPSSDMPIVDNHPAPYRVGIRARVRVRIEERRKERRTNRKLRKNPNMFPQGQQGNAPADAPQAAR